MDTKALDTIRRPFVPDPASGARHRSPRRFFNMKAPKKFQEGSQKFFRRANRSCCAGELETETGVLRFLRGGLNHAGPQARLIRPE